MSGSIMSQTGNGTSRLERSASRGTGQGEYPQESEIIVTPVVTALLTTPQSGGWVTRIGHGSPMEQPQERPAGQMDRAGADTRQTKERKAHTDHSARKRKECPTEEEHRCTRSRYTESTQTAPAVQALWETYSHSTPVTQAPRPSMASEWIQHQDQPRDRILVAHGKGSTGYSSDVPEVEKMAASPQKVQATAPFMNTSRGVQGHEGDDEIQSQEHKLGASGIIGGVGLVGPGPPLHPEGDGSLCTAVVLSKTTRERQKDYKFNC